MKNTIDPKVFDMAANLFGFGTMPEKRKMIRTVATEVAMLQDTEKLLMVAYPAIIDRAFAATMEAYRKWVSIYNFKTEAENKAIEIFNSKLVAPADQTIVQSTFLKTFLSKYKNKQGREYNNLVDDFNATHGDIIAKKLVQTVKFGTELVFQNLLHLYNAQLIRQNEVYIKLGISANRPVEKFKINSLLVTELRRDGVKSLGVCKKTVRNHRDRLLECGVFVDYHFSGRQRAVELSINPEILTVLDIKTGILISLENQQLTNSKEKVLLDNNESTRTIINEIEIKKKKEFPPVTPIDFFTGTPAVKYMVSSSGPPEIDHSRPETASTKLQKLIIHPHELAQNLSNQHYTNYIPIDIEVLEKEAYGGTMLKEDFRTLVIQDFFKQISRIYKTTTPYCGSWKIAITMYMQHKFVSFNGTAFNKNVVVDDVAAIRWRLNWAINWFTKNSFPPLFPAQYFDMTRKTSKEVGFEYTKLKYEQHLLGVEKYKKLKINQQKHADIRKNQANNAIKFETAINKFMRNRITMTELMRYVGKNLPSEFLNNVGSAISSKSIELSNTKYL
jgi:hypothetical protein